MTSSIRRGMAFVVAGNPIYAIAAALFLRGLRMLYTDGAERGLPWMLAAMLGGYAALVGWLAVWIIRRLRVWDDARTILIVLAVLLISGSMLFDEAIVRFPLAGCYLLAGSWLFGAAVTDAVIRAARLPMAVGCQWIWCGILASFHLWPALTSVLLFHYGPDAANGCCAAFPTVVALVASPALMFLRRWSLAEAPTGSGWSFPGYPLSLFAVTGMAAALRAPLLALSYGGGHAEQSIFGVWMTLPLTFVAGLALVEVAAIVGSKPWTVVAACWPLIVAVAVVGGINDVPAARSYAANFDKLAGAYWLWAFVCATVLYLSVARRGSVAFDWPAMGMAGVLLLLALQPYDSREDRLPNHWPLAATALAFGMATQREQMSGYLFTTTMLSVGAVWSSFGHAPREAVTAGSALGLLIFAGLLLAVTDDRHRTGLAWIFGGLAALVGFAAARQPLIGEFTSFRGAQAIALLAIATIGELLTRQTGSWAPRIGALVCVGVLTVRALAVGWELAMRMPEGAVFVGTGLFALIPAVIISHAKRARE